MFAIDGLAFWEIQCCLFKVWYSIIRLGLIRYMLAMLILWNCFLKKALSSPILAVRNISPSHSLPSPEYAAKQLHRYDPLMLLHATSALQSCVPEEHSSISENIYPCTYMHEFPFTMYLFQHSFVFSVSGHFNDSRSAAPYCKKHLTNRIVWRYPGYIVVSKQWIFCPLKNELYSLADTSSCSGTTIFVAMKTLSNSNSNF